MPKVSYASTIIHPSGTITVGMLYTVLDAPAQKRYCIVENGAERSETFNEPLAYNLVSPFVFKQLECCARTTWILGFLFESPVSQCAQGSDTVFLGFSICVIKSIMTFPLKIASLK